MPTVANGTTFFSTSTSQTTWNLWTGGTDTTTTGNTLIWNLWADIVTVGTTTVPTIIYSSIPTVQTVPTEEERRDQARQAEAARLEREAAYAAVRREAEEATARARQLLAETLTDEQRAEYQTTRSFRVLSADGARVYRIDQGTHGNVKLLDASGKVRRSYCIQPGGVPTEDAMLAQKLWLEHDEAAFLRVAVAS